MIPCIRVETIDNRVYVSESVRKPGSTHKVYYPVEYQVMEHNTVIELCIFGAYILFVMYVAYEIWTLKK